eukprot:239778_1
MASAEHTLISKELLETLHRHQLMNGETNDVHREAIVNALGGIDEILQHLFTSNVVLDQQQLDSLHHFITNTSHKDQQNEQITTMNAVPQLKQQQDESYHHTFTYTFKDEDSFLFTVFGQENGNKILDILNGPIMKCIWVLVFAVECVLFVLTEYGLSWEIVLSCWAVGYLFGSIYIIGWILYLNTE